MTTTDANGIVFLQDTDNISPFQTLINGLQTATSIALDTTSRIFRAADAASQAAILAAHPGTPAAPTYVDRTDLGVLQRNTTSSSTNWTTVAGVDVVGTLTYGTGWSAPVASPASKALALYRRGDRAYLQAGNVENTATTTLSQYGQTATDPSSPSLWAVTIPSGYRPAAIVRIPTAVNVAGAFLASGQVLVYPTGMVVLQTTTAWSAVATGNGKFSTSDASWTIAS